MLLHLPRHSGLGGAGRLAPAWTHCPLLCRCMCGAPSCRGTMDTQPERFKDFGKRIEIWWEGDGVFYRGTVLQYHTASGKHTVLYDDGESEKISLGLMRHRSGPRNCASTEYVGRCVELGPRTLQCLLVYSSASADAVVTRRAAVLKFGFNTVHLFGRWLAEDASPHASPQPPEETLQGLPPSSSLPAGEACTPCLAS